MNHIIIELCAEDRARLDAIIEGLNNITATPATATLEAIPEVPAPAEQSEPADAPAPAPIVEPTTVEPTPAEPEVKPISLAEFQKAVTLAVSKGAPKKTIKAIINKYAPSVSEVPEDKRAEAVAALAEI